jgi:hypothetical protein
MKKTWLSYLGKSFKLFFAIGLGFFVFFELLKVQLA